MIRAHDDRYGKSFKAETRARNALAFAGAFRARGVRHIHVHFANRATHTALFLAELGFTFSFTAHAKDFMVDLGSDDLLREMAAAATRVVAVSEFSRDLLVQTCPDSADKIVRVYNGIDPDAFPKADPATRDSGAPLRIISVGRLVGIKGWPDLIAACSLLRDRGIETQLDIIGSGPLRAELEAQIESSKLSGNITLLGTRSQQEIRRRLADADVFALACRRDDEGGTDILPTVIMEAMAARLPVVSTGFVGIPEMVEAGESGFLAPPESPEALADALAKLAADRQLAARMGAAGESLCKQRFATVVTVAELADQFPAEALEPAPSQPPGLAYLAASPTGEPALHDELAAAASRPGVTVLAMRARNPAAPEDAGTYDFLPDGVVIEASWRRAAPRWPEIDALRAKLGSSVDGEDFYREARRAVYLVETSALGGSGPSTHPARARFFSPTSSQSSVGFVPPSPPNAAPKFRAASSPNSPTPSRMPR